MDEISVLIERSQTGDKAARDTLIERNLGLVHHIVRRFLGRGYDPEDLFQIGTIGLIKAIDKFNLELGVKFSTYAVPMIAGEIKRFLRDDGMVKVSRTVKENAFKVRSTRQLLQNSLGREPTLEEISVHSGLSREDIVMALEVGVEVESLYSVYNQEDGSEVYLVDKVVRGAGGCVGVNVGSAGDISADAEKEDLLDHLLINQLMGELGERERLLINLRYFQNKTQTEVANVFGISQVQVSRLEKKILLVLREKIH